MAIKTREELQIMKEQTQKTEAEQYFQSAEQLKQNGKIEEAIIAGERAIELEPEKDRYYLFLGDLLSKTGKIEAAISCYESALEANPDSFLVCHKLGDVLEKDNKIEQAIKYQEKAIQLNPRFGWSYFYLGNIFNKQGLQEKAVHYYQQAINCNPKSTNAQFCIKLGETLQAQGELNQAIKIYKSLLKSDAKNKQESLIYYKIGLVLSEQKKYDEAITNLIKALQSQPNYRQAYQKLGDLLCEKNQRDDAAKCFKNILPKNILSEFGFLETRNKIALTAELNNVEIRKVNSSYKVSYSPPKTLDGKVPPLLQTSQAKIPETFVAIIPNGRAYLDGYNNAFISSDNQLLADISSENAELIIASDKLPNPVQIDGTFCSLVTPGAGGVYYHWMVDLLPRIELVRQSGISLDSIDKFLVNRYKSRFQKETLNHLGISSAKIIESEKYPHVKAKKMIIPVLNNSNGIKAGKWIYDFLKREFIVNEREKIVAHSPRIYISRSQAKSRKIINENEVINFLSKLGFQSVILESMPVIQQANLMSQAEAIVSPHGAGLTNLAFCSSGAKVIEIFGEHINPSYWAISNSCELDYYSLFCDNSVFELEKSNTVQYIKDFQARNKKDILVNIDSLSSLIEMSGLI
ncbi:MAG: tetratricopeptide repeat protein [Gomphosphaeria aponina SAG 52.96 = DSM 107014]|uniref:Tetratricopeptide repeat protein n=1 Tax=Gomphosphaeria aponina SAG 52.96 = DSM 107014 TaxID=1521640 RepID=A0A941GUD0_9CHRO|nr:tetratricopeptide repeat protein [Gomphosphaeria aponina SAG 52.96 = DSM 107014]